MTRRLRNAEVVLGVPGLSGLGGGGGGATDPEVVRDVMGVALLGGANVLITPNDESDRISIAAVDVVNTTSDQTIAGIKTFNAIPLLPGPATAPAHAATKAYVDSVSGGTATYNWLDAVRLNETPGWPTDEYSMVAAKITEAGVGGTLVVPVDPTKYYYIGGTLVPLQDQTWVGGGTRYPWDGRCDFRAFNGQTAPLVKVNATTNHVHFYGLNFQGDNNPTSAGQSGIDTTIGGCAAWKIIDCSFLNFPEEAIKFGDSVACWFSRIFASSCLTRTAGRIAVAGVLDINGSDHWVNDIETGVGTRPETGGTYGSGYRAAMLYRGTSGFISGIVAELSEVGLVLNGFFNTLTDCRADQNLGHGFVINGDDNQLVALKSLSNG